MATSHSRKRSRSRSQEVLQRPSGVIHPRVQNVGPEHFGIVSVDCAKARSKWMLADFYGNIIIPPTIVEHNRAGLEAAISQVRQTLPARALQDCLVAVERTGRYHRPVQRAFAAAHFEVRIVHPFATKQFRQPSDPGYKTDDTDLAAIHRAAVNGFRARKTQEILGLERQIAASLVHTPYILLLSFPGINVVSAADYAGEMGPIEHYANPRCITGRAGLRPCRYQSDQVDRANGPLVRNCNRKLRAAILGIADNLVCCNHHFNVLGHHWKAAGKDPRDVRIRVANRFCRISFQMVAGRQVFHHPGLQARHYIIEKLTAFHRDHDTPGADMLRDLEAAVAQLPRQEYQAEAGPLHKELERIEAGGRRGPQLLGNILPIVLARLGVGAVQSTASGDQDPH